MENFDYIGALSDSQINPSFIYASSDKEWSLSDFNLANCLGEGRFGTVFLAKETRTKFNYVVALKTFSKESLIKNNLEFIIKNELEIHKSCKHPNIANNYGFFHNEIKIYFILEFCPNGNLFDKIADKPLDEPQAATYIRQITDAVAYIHSREIVHRDIKPENILIGLLGEAKLTDFSWATYVTPENILTDLCGTLDYICPEMLCNEPHNTKVDIWCIGVLCYELLVKKSPFFSRKKGETQNLIKKVKFTVPVHLSLEANNFIKKVLVRKPEERLEALAMLKEPWLSKNSKDKEH